MKAEIDLFKFERMAVSMPPSLKRFAQAEAAEMGVSEAAFHRAVLDHYRQHREAIRPMLDLGDLGADALAQMLGPLEGIVQRAVAVALREVKASARR